MAAEGADCWERETEEWSEGILFVYNKKAFVSWICENSAVHPICYRGSTAREASSCLGLLCLYDLGDGSAPALPVEPQGRGL